MHLARRPKQAFLLLCDLLLSATAAMLAALVLGRPWTALVLEPGLWIQSGLAVALLYTAALYSPDLAFHGKFPLFRLGLAFVLAAGFMGIYLFLDLPLVSLDRRAWAVFSLLSFLFVLVGRIAETVLSRSGLFRTRVAFIGSIPAFEEIKAEMEKHSGLGWDPVLSLGSGKGSGIEVQDLSSFMEAVGERRIDIIVVGEGASLDRAERLALFDLLSRRLRFYSVPDFFEAVTRRVPIGLIDELWFLENIDLKRRRWYSFFKRLLDLGVGVLVFLLSLPLWPFIALAVRLSSPGPVFFTQVRLGRNGKPFRMIKFRTMRTSDNSFMPTAKGGDPRITKVGAFLRSSRLDELPQILNVLRGEMSFVGPRPERPELAAELEKEVPYFRQRLLVKPGLTGWDQVSGEYHSPSVSDTYLKLQYDLYYIKFMSPALDGSIFFKTIMTVLSRAGV